MLYRQNEPVRPEDVYARVRATQRLRAWEDARTAAPGHWFGSEGNVARIDAIFDPLRPPDAHLAFTSADFRVLVDMQQLKAATPADFAQAYAALLCARGSKSTPLHGRAARAVESVFPGEAAAFAQDVRTAGRQAYDDYRTRLTDILAARDSDGVPSIAREPAQPGPRAPRIPAELLEKLAERVRATIEVQEHARARYDARRAGWDEARVREFFDPLKPDADLQLTQADRRCLTDGHALNRAEPEDIATAYATVVCSLDPRPTGLKRRAAALMATVYTGDYDVLHAVRAETQRECAVKYADVRATADAPAPEVANLRRSLVQRLSPDASPATVRR